MSLIAILSSFGMNSYLNSQKRARDAERQSDLYQYKVALENYASVINGNYPEASGVASTVLATPLANYMTGFPTDPKGNTYYYSGDASKWVLQSCLESGTGTQGYQVCSDGRSGNGGTCGSQADTTCDL
ncbi:MAG: hypothetical protein UU93_C0006G0004 [Candidatus Amesbacteria bacterium GW2011_GWA2_42_12]|uniref:Type II secretion system protein GspG C-terminal domain-containing protein n=1 Tax=Candidatus Amesbacteria bacterium GW2011_GWA2_42_12 TaxID=1618356 RepID=A0A0G0Y6Z8_9BACT|nr:MAG: hypothetical protein UU93_C0006G0004 [Candidatus Amesbacteria bacterium GW2011_GWA2_42_12]